MNTFAPVGLYSISVRGLDVPDLLSWAAHHGIPFVHLRGGKRGYDLAAQDASTLARWREASTRTVPVTGVTADTDLADLLSTDPALRRQARREVHRLADAARAVGAGWLRLLARHPLKTTDFAADSSWMLDGLEVPLLIELHDPQWLAERPHAAMVCLLQRQPRLHLLADTAQLAQAFVEPDDGRTAERLDGLGPWIKVLHLSDPGPGLVGPGHSVVADHVMRRITDGQRIEVAVEWTGADRTPAAALTRYRDHTAWWSRRSTARPEAGS
ncbi:sugar phosphate isomerase/epimerase family protein [Streptomyces sp. NPDC058417]|uniref:sugar phosphate isomerase/epimerase family protein n=1 Tax=unclassified Streptomyces TaxID=2593676 RepID=UPI00364D1AF8